MTLHYPVKLSQVEAMESGVLPLVDPYRAGGQPLLGNPNSVALYPDNLLYLVAPTLWALNAHFWIHWLLAPLSMFWLARELGLRRDSSWAAATVWSLSGFFMSNMNFYNLIAGVALAPALVAACLRSLSCDLRARRQGLLAVAGLCFLQALSGDPMISVQAVLMSGLAVLSRVLSGDVRSKSGAWKPVAGVVSAAAAGLLFAWPQISEFLRILEVSFRSSFGYEGDLGLQASWDPRMFLEWLLPFAYGQPNLSFWGEEIYGSLAIYYSTHPGVLGLLLVLVSGARRTSVRVWAWTLILLGLFLSLGQFNPLVAWLADAPGAKLLRFPVKFWLLVSVGGAVLGGLGWQRVFGESSASTLVQARFTRLGGLLILLYVAIAGVLVQFPEFFRTSVGSLMAEEFLADRPEEVRLRWLALSVLLALVTALFLGIVRVLRGRAYRGLVVLILHAAVQTMLMLALVPTDSPAHYTRRPALLDFVKPGESVVQLGAYGNFSGRTSPSVYPDRRPYWTARQGYEELRSYGGVGFGQGYELNVSAEGLDSFLAEATLWALRPAERRPAPSGA